MRRIDHGFLGDFGVLGVARVALLVACARALHGDCGAAILPAAVLARGDCSSFFDLVLAVTARFFGAA